MSSKTALIVDDSKSARFALRKYLENHGYRVEAFEGALAAYEYLKSQRPDIIFLDHIMPGIDGFEALAHILQDEQLRTIPTVICSSNEGVSFNEEARSRGAAGVLQKPPSPDQLQRLLGGLPPEPASDRVEFSVAAAPAIPPAAPAKVTNIREPEVAIEQAVMKALRTAMPSAPAAVVAPPAPVAVEAAKPSGPPLREQIDERIRKVTQDLFVQVAALRADMEQQENRPTVDEAGMREEINALRAGLDALEQSFSGQLATLQHKLTAGFAEQTQRLEQLAQSARQAAAEEAQAVAERAVMAAAARVSDQLAQSIMHAFHTPQGRRAEG